MKVGFAQVDYTPELGLPLMGNYRDDYGACGIHDPLCAKAAVFADSSGKKLGLMSVDICFLNRDNVAMMRRFIESGCGIAAENIFIAATHTHSGPGAVKVSLRPKADDAVVENFLHKAASAMLLANEKLGDCTIAIGHGTENRISFNRRLKCKDGQTHMNWEGLEPDFVIDPLGPTDPEVITLCIEQAGELKASIVNFGLHPAILAGDNWLYSADYPGYLSEAMSRMFGDGFLTMFFTGCCGNVNHIDYSDTTQGRGYQMSQRIGYTLAVAAKEAINHQISVTGDSLGVSSEMVCLDWLKLTEQQQSWAENILENAQDKPPAKGQVDGLPDEFYAELWMEQKNKNGNDEVEVMAVRIGDVGIVGLPGECFCEFAMEIKQRSPAKHTLVVGLANDAIGYIPTDEAFEQAGYEPTPGVTRYAKGSGRKLVDSAVNQLEGLFKK